MTSEIKETCTYCQKKIKEGQLKKVKEGKSWHLECFIEYLKKKGC